MFEDFKRAFLETINYVPEYRQRVEAVLDSIRAALTPLSALNLIDTTDFTARLAVLVDRETKILARDFSDKQKCQELAALVPVAQELDGLVAAALVQAQACAARKLRIDASLAHAGTTITPIAEPLAKTPLETRLAALQAERTTAYAERSLDRLDPALIALEPKAATLDADAAANAALSVKVAAARKTIDDGLADAATRLAALTEATAKADSLAKLADLQLEKTAAYAKPDIAQLSAAAGTLAGKIPVLIKMVVASETRQPKIVKAKQDLDRDFTNIESWVNVLGQDSVKTAYRGWFDALALRKPGVYAKTVYVDMAADLVALRTELLALYAAIKTANSGVNDIDAKVTELVRVLKDVKAIPGTDSDVNPLIAEARTLLGDRPTRLTGADAAAINGNIATFLSDLTTLLGKANKLKIDKTDVPGKQAEIDAALLDLKTAIDGLATTTPGLADLKTKQTALIGENTTLAPQTDLKLKAEGLIALLPRILELLKEARKAELKAKLAQVDGKKAIDDQIKAFAGKTTNPQQDALCRAALEVRFDMTLKIADNIRTKKLPKLYELMLLVPESHTAANDKLKLMEYGTEGAAKGNYYSGDTQKIAFNAMAEDETTQPYVPDVGAQVDPVYYDATTLHEVGHAVDEKLGYMNTNMGNAKHGQWKVQTIDEVVDAHAAGGFVGRFTGVGKKPTEADLKKLLKLYLSGKTPAKPASDTAELGTLFDDWDGINADATITACKDCITDKKPWDGGKGKAASIAVGGRVYQESYAGKWHSYALAERDGTGVSAYQWRAPGEWFAEVYAMYYLKKLPSAHPMTAWLSAQ